MWEIFPLQPARAGRWPVWGIGVMMAPILGPTVGGWVCDNWSWPWIFYVNLPIGVLGFLHGEHRSCSTRRIMRKPTSVDWPGLVLMVLGLRRAAALARPGGARGLVRVVADRGLALLAIMRARGFAVRELTAQ